MLHYPTIIFILQICLFERIAGKYIPSDHDRLCPTLVEIICLHYLLVKVKLVMVSLVLILYLYTVFVLTSCNMYRPL